MSIAGLLMVTWLFAGAEAADTGRSLTPAALVGCWENASSTAREVWVSESDGAFVGYAQSLADGRFGGYEILTLRRADDGTWIYTAFPSGRDGVAFTSRGFEGNVIRFENAAHDYPQRIEYTLYPDRLEAVISLVDGGSRRTFSWSRCR